MTQPSKADKLIYKAFCLAMERNLLRIYMDTARINRPSSPVYNPWENLLPLLVPIIIGLILIVTVGSLFGLAFIIGMILIYNYYVKKIIDKRLLERAKKYILTDYQHCQELWKFGGLVLATSTNKKTGCISPEGDWKDFTVQNFADFMLDTSTDKTPDEETAA